MSASIQWRPAITGWTSLPLWAPQAFLASLREGIGKDTGRFDQSDLPLLRAMQAAASDEHMKAGFKEFADAIEKHGEVELRAEY